MAKRSKIILCIVIAIACVSCCFLPIIASASSVNTSVYTNPYCPTLYGNYVTAGGDYGSRQTGGYAQDYRLLVNSRSTFLLTTRYLEAGAFNSILNDGYLSTTFDNSDPASEYYGTDSIIYGASTIFNDWNSYIYMPFYRVRDFGLSVYVSEGSNLNYNVQTILNDYNLPYDSAFMEFTVTYYNDEGGKFFYEDYISLNDTVFYASQDFQSMRTYLLNRDPNFSDDCYFYSIGIAYRLVYNTDPNVRVYSNTLIAIGDAEDYVDNQEYVLGIRDFGYNRGFADGSDFADNGVWGLVTASVGGFLNFEIYGGFTIGQLLMICLSVPLFIWIIKLLAGG